MIWYCSKCKKHHKDDELCPRMKTQLKENPNILTDALNFITVAVEERLIKTQAWDKVCQGVNRLVGTDFSYEGTNQLARDIQVFKRLNDEPFSRCGAFASPEKAQSYFENVQKVAQNKPRAMTSFESKLTGYSQEVDWLRWKKGQISSLWEKSSLLNDNAAGVDGITVNRFNGKTINRTTCKASVNPMNSNSTGINDVKEAITKGTATDQDIIFGSEGVKEASKGAGLTNPVVEKNTTDQIRSSNNRLKEKIANGQATTSVTIDQVGKKMAQGAIVGAIVSVAISSICTYIRYRNGELSKEEAFRDVAEDTIKGCICGAGMGAVTIFLPSGFVGWVCGIAIGIYFSKACTNVLDEIFGKGVYGAILDSAGYIYGTTYNLGEYLKQIELNDKQTECNINNAIQLQRQIESNFDKFERSKKEY